jgi:hypothetical protein
MMVQQIQEIQRVPMANCSPFDAIHSMMAGQFHLVMKNQSMVVVLL